MASLNLKKAAMFGLDARIALAIFGALSVISGAALYSAIQQSKVVALLTDFQEIGKAYDAYYLDTGVESPVLLASVYLNIKELVDSSVANWSGPYLSYSDRDNTSLTHTTYGDIRLAEALDGTWTDNTVAASWNTTIECSAGSVGGSCGVWVMIKDIPDEIYRALDIYVDGSAGDQTGNVRVVNGAAASQNHVFVKYRAKQ
tara:strand:+ start:498 stop:1100 length:603 start_codon:yes stop_codon:yes gene_type:complete